MGPKRILFDNTDCKKILKYCKKRNAWMATGEEVCKYSKKKFHL